MSRIRADADAAAQLAPIAQLGKYHDRLETNLLIAYSIASWHKDEK